MQRSRYLLLAALLIAAHAASAVEVTPGDYEQSPAGTNMALFYYQHATTDALYASGHQVSGDFKLTSDVGILRLIHVFGLSERVTVDPQVLLPFARIDTGGDAAALGDTSGVGDLIVAAPVRYRLNAAHDILAITPYVYLPTGRYAHDASLNLGENRWKFDLQAAYVTHFSDQWALDLVGDAIWYGDNDDAGPSSARLQQDMAYAVQLMGRYMPAPGTSFGLGIGHTWGGETRLDGAWQDDRQRTTNLRLTAAKFLTAKDQVQLQLGRDMAVETGTRERFRVNLRYLRVF
jgi:hypothetical protein